MINMSAALPNPFTHRRTAHLRNGQPDLTNRSGGPADRGEEVFDGGEHAGQHGDGLGERAGDVHAVVGVRHLEDVRGEAVGGGGVPGLVGGAPDEEERGGGAFQRGDDGREDEQRGEPDRGQGALGGERGGEGGERLADEQRPAADGVEDGGHLGAYPVLEVRAVRRRVLPPGVAVNLRAPATGHVTGVHQQRSPGAVQAAGKDDGVRHVASVSNFGARGLPAFSRLTLGRGFSAGSSSRSSKYLSKRKSSSSNSDSRRLRTNVRGLRSSRSRSWNSGPSSFFTSSEKSRAILRSPRIIRPASWATCGSFSGPNTKSATITRRAISPQPT